MEYWLRGLKNRDLSSIATSPFPRAILERQSIVLILEKIIVGEKIAFLLSLR